MPEPNVPEPELLGCREFVHDRAVTVPAPPPLRVQGLLMLSASVSTARGYVPDVARWLNRAAAAGDVDVAKQVNVRVKVCARSRCTDRPLAVCSRLMFSFCDGLVYLLGYTGSV
jgi:hypothetical protein